MPTALFITIIVFLLSHLAPGDAVSALAGPESPPELVEKMSHIKDDFVLDGELLVWNFKEQIAFDFSLLQK